MSLEHQFKEFLVQEVSATDIDSLDARLFPKKKADYVIEKENSIFEVKSLVSDRAEVLEPWLRKRVENTSEINNGMPVVFGRVSFEQLFEGHSNKTLFAKQIESLFSRTLEDYVRDAKHQLFDTKKALTCENAFGFLVILNETKEFYETSFVCRVMQEMQDKIIENDPHLKIDGILYINEATREDSIADVFFVHESGVSSDLRPNQILSELAGSWAQYRGYTAT